MKNYTILFILLFIFFFPSCDKKNRLEEEKFLNRKNINSCVKKVDNILRSEIKIFKNNDQDFDLFYKKMNRDYPFFFQDTLFNFFKEISADINYNIIFDSVYVHYKENNLFTNPIKKGLCLTNKYFKTPNYKIISIIDDDIVDTFTPPFNPIIIDKEKNLIIIQLQWFLGKNHIFYTNRKQPVPEYISERYSSEFIASLLLHELSKTFCDKKENNLELFSIMLNEAKPYLFLDLIMPDFEEHIIFGCTKEDIDFFNKNEGSVWKHILENQFLFSSNTNLKQKFIIPTSSNELGTPGRFGIWIGWQILRSYFNNNNVSIQEVLKENNYLKILNKANYKP